MRSPYPSGTTAPHIALLAHGIGSGDEIITTPFKPARRSQPESPNPQAGQRNRDAGAGPAHPRADCVIHTRHERADPVARHEGPASVLANDSSKAQPASSGVLLGLGVLALVAAIAAGGVIWLRKGGHG